MSAITEEPKVDGLGVHLLDQGVAFRVWAPHADKVSVIGDFNDWTADAHPLDRDENGCWFGQVDSAEVGQEYKFSIQGSGKVMERIDPYAREVTNSVGNGVIHDPSFDWQDDAFEMPDHNELVIYEMHIGTYHREDADQPGGFRDAIKRFDHLKELGVNAIEVMPIAEFAGDWSWGYNPAHIFAIEQAYGGPRAFKEFVREAHNQGLAVIMDVVYNHFGPSDLDLWQFDGWSENEKGGIYFYNDWRSTTPWGDTRPDYGRGEVRQFIYDNARMWLEEYHADGLRYDMTAYIRKVHGIDASDIPEGWTLMQWINGDVRESFPRKLLVAEDLQGNSYLTAPIEAGGAGFSTQWDAHFVHPVRDVVEQVEDNHRDMGKVLQALTHRYNEDAFQRVVYSESHDEIANGKSRVPEEIDPENPESVHAKKRSLLAAGLVFTTPGIPMIMQGQEFLEDGWFDDGDPLDWQRAERFKGLTRLYADLIDLRLNRQGNTYGLSGQHIDVHHLNSHDKVVAFHRWREGGTGDDVLVVVNLANRQWDSYRIGVPAGGNWVCRLNSDWSGYSEDFDDHAASEVKAVAEARDGKSHMLDIPLAAYSIQIFSQKQE